MSALKYIWLGVAMVFSLNMVNAQFDDLYYDGEEAIFSNQDYDEEDFTYSDEYAYEEEYDEDEYFDDYNVNDEYYDGYEYTRRLNRFNRQYSTNNYYSYFYTNPLFLDRGYNSNFWYDPYYSRSFTTAYLNPFVYGSGLSVNINVGNRFRRVNRADLYYMYINGLISYNDYRWATTRNRFGGVGFGRPGIGGFNTFGGVRGGFAGAYYCPPVGGIARIASPNAISRDARITSSRNVNVNRSRVSSARNRSGVSPGNRGTTGQRVASATGNSRTSRSVSSNGRSRDYSTSANSNNRSRSKNSISKERRDSRNASSVRNSNSSRRNSNSVRGNSGSRRTSNVGSRSNRKANSNFRPSTGTRRSSGISRGSSSRSGTKISRGSSSSRNSSSRRRQ